MRRQLVTKRFKTLQNDFYCKMLFSIVVLKSFEKFLSHFVAFCGCLFTARKTRVFFFFASATKKRLSDEVKHELSKPKQKVEANNSHDV